jgi:ankyrin repeat protein
MVDKAVGAFIDAVVLDEDRARALLEGEPRLLNARWIHGETALHFLAVEGAVAAVRFLAACGADVDATNEFGDTALVDVAVLGNLEMAKVLLECGANPNASSKVRDNVLHAAASSGRPEILRLLLKAGARADYVTDLGETIWDAIRRREGERVQMEAVLADEGVGEGRPTTGCS